MSCGAKGGVSPEVKRDAVSKLGYPMCSPAQPRTSSTTSRIVSANDPGRTKKTEGFDRETTMATLYTPEIQVPRPDYLGGNLWNLKNLKPITVILGRNGSGKSLLLRQWRDLSQQQSHYIAPERTGAIDYAAQYLQQEGNPNERRNVSSRNFVEAYRSRVIVRIQHYFMTRGDFRGNQPPNNPTELEALLGKLLPDFAIQLSARGAPPYNLFRLPSYQPVTTVDQLSSGEVQLFTLGLDILTMAAIWEMQGETARTLLIDEPDTHIHPDLQARFADFLASVAERFALQLVIATHSTSLLAAIGQFARDDTGILFMDRNLHHVVDAPFQ